MKRPGNVFLVGPMGAGKSTIGRQLAQMLKMDFVDSDQVIESRAGADISWIFDVEGEDGFRIREAAVIDELTQRQGIVLATGGGAILCPESRTHLAARGVVIYLQASIEQQMARTMRDRRRPIVQKMPEDGRLEAFNELDAERDPLYAEIADYAVSTDERTVRTVAQDIILWFEKDLV